MSLKRPLAQEIWLGLPDCFSSWEGGVWGRDYIPISQLCSTSHFICVQSFRMGNINVPTGVCAPLLDTQHSTKRWLAICNKLELGD